MQKLIPALALLCALVFATTAAAVDVGANDDTGKYAADGGAAFFAQMASAGLKQNVMTARWTPGSRGLADQDFLDVAVPQAIAAGIAPVLAVYPYPPSALGAAGAGPAAFVEWLAAVAARYPQVRTYIVGNEPNLNTFWRPQGDGAGRIYSGASFGPYLAAAYDALKAASPELTVLGVGLSPRGDRIPGASGKASPMHFLRSLGDWYRASGRPARLMDGFSYHPYPSPSDFAVPFTFRYAWPNAGIHELHRVKQALWDAFTGTPQPTTRQGLKLYLDEVGWQVSTVGDPAYTGTENVRVTTEAAQAAIYDRLVRHVVCDPDVAQLNFFGYWDERDRSGWQSALRRADGTERPANAAVAAAIADTGGTCRGVVRRWKPLTRPEAARVTFGPLPRKVTVGVPRTFGFLAVADEDVSVRVGLVPARAPAARMRALLQDRGLLKAHRKPQRRLRAAPAAGKHVLAVLLTAQMNPARTALFVSPTITAERPRTPKPLSGRVR